MAEKKKETKSKTSKEETKETVKEEAVDYKKLYEEKSAELDGINDQYKRLMAEYDNFKKRTVKEKEALYSDSVKDTISELLPVIDNLQRAIGAFEDKESEHYKGVEMVLKQTEEIFKKIGVEEIKAVGEKFNPEYHNAIMHIDDESVADNTVVEEFMKGYIYKDKVIRYSMVKVAN